MKFSLAFLIALALSGAVDIQAGPIDKSSELHHVLEEFLALVPVEKVAEIFLEYETNDPQVQAVMEYMMSEGFRELVKRVESIDDIINFYDYLAKAGLDIYGLVNKLHELIGLPPLVPHKLNGNFKITGGVAGLIADIKAVLPIDDIKALYHEKLDSSPAFAELVKRLRSPKFQKLIDALRANEEFKKIVSFCKEAGVDVKAIMDLLSTIFGLQFPDHRYVLMSGDDKSSELHHVLEEFVALVPVEKVTEIVIDYVTNDAQVQAVIEYAKSDDFRELVRRVESIEDVINFYNYIAESGLDIYGLVNKLHEAIGLPPLVPHKIARNFKITGGVAGLIADIKAVLPIDDIKALYHEKLDSSPAFAELVKRLRSPKFQKLIDALRANEEFKKIVSFCKEAGIDIKAIMDLLTTIFGLQFPDHRYVLMSVDDKSSELHHVLEEFVALVPVEKVTEIVIDYVTNDNEVQAVIEYAKSDDFRELVRRVESIEDVINFYNYIAESSLDIYGLVNKLHEAIGLPPLVPHKIARNFKITGGVAGLIADIKAVLPIDDIKALYHEKLDSSPAFAELVKRLRSPKFQKLIDALRANEEFRKIVGFFKEAGVDIKAIMDLLTTIFGLQFPDHRYVLMSVDDKSSELHHVLEEFVALVPVEKFTEIVIDYVTNDHEVQAVIEYTKSDDFKELVRRVESIEDVINFYNYIAESGLDIYGLVNKLHEAIGLSPLVPNKIARNFKITGGVAGLIADIKAILPIDDIKALYHEKLESSPAFAELVERLRSPKFQKLIDALRANKEFRKIVGFFKEAGVDIKAIMDLLSTIFGLQFPDHGYILASHDVEQDLLDFQDLLPTEQIKAMAMDYLSNDPEIYQLAKYMHSNDFRKRLLKIESVKEAKDVLAFIQDCGLDVYAILNSLHKLVQLPPFKPISLDQRTGGVRGYVTDVKAILPQKAIDDLHREKMETSPAYARLVNRLNSRQFSALVEMARFKREARVILDDFLAHGFDILAIVDLVSSGYGLKALQRNDLQFSKSVSELTNDELVRDLADFLALLPIQDMIDVSFEYVFNDPEVQNAAAYLQTKEFVTLATNAEQNDEFRHFVGYLDASGLPATTYMNMLNDFLEIPKISPLPKSLKTLMSGKGVRGMMDDIEALLPRGHIKQMYELKMQSSKAFRFFIKHLQAPEFQTIIDKLARNEAFQKLGYRAAELGINLQTIVEFMSRVFGIEIPKDLLPPATFAKSPLDRDLEEFINFIPTGKIKSIATRHYIFDSEFRRAYKYVCSEQFYKLLRVLHKIPEYNELLESLRQIGLDVDTLIAQIHKAIGFPKETTNDVEINSYGVASFVSEVKATLPIESIKALYRKKIETSPDFVRLVKLISSDKFQAVTNALFADETFKYILHKLMDYGINMKAVSDFFFAIFGITTPPGVIPTWL